MTGAPDLEVYNVAGFYSRFFARGSSYCFVGELAFGAVNAFSVLSTRGRKE
jgi:hypothetical protein